MVRPFITVEKIAQDVLNFYETVFPDFSLLSLKHHAEPHNELVMLATFSIGNQEIMISDSFVSHKWNITPGISFFMDVDSEQQLKSLAEKLSATGKVHMPAGNYGFSTLFAWVEDQFGINWQLKLE